MKKVLLCLIILLCGCSNQKPVIEYTTTDMKAINKFEEYDNKINDLLSKQNIDDIKDKLKGTFITIVDFIFYDSEINGVTFNELTDNGKKKILDFSNTIDKKIENRYPNYKDNISNKTSDAFNKASEIIKEGIINFKDFSKDKLGEKNYNSIIEAKDELKEFSNKAFTIIGNTSSNLFNKSKDYLKNWYEKIKEN